MSIDLHCHTVFSDGSTVIEDLLMLAKLRNIQTVGITDHNSFVACTRAVVVGKRLGVNVVPGAEISCCHKERNLNMSLLCYYPENTNRLEGLLKKINDSHKKSMIITMQKVARVYPITLEAVIKKAQGSSSIFKQHIMQVLMDSGYTDYMFGDVHDKLFKDRIGLANTKADYPCMLEVIEEIRGAGGLVVLPHPTHILDISLAEELLEKNLIDGVECNYPDVSPDGANMLKELTLSHSKIVTGGTNFHGANIKNSNTVGTFITEKDQFIKMKKLKNMK